MFLFRHFSTKINKAPITITNNAWNKIISIIEKSNGKGMLFSAIGGGCNGFNYNLELIEKNIIPSKINSFSNINKNNAYVYIDPLSELYLIGTTIDYINEDFSKGVFENKFVYKIDRELASSCGCGVSFMPRNLK